MKKPVKWSGPAIHVGVALAFFGVAAYLRFPLWALDVMLILNSVGWIAREIRQHWPNPDEVLTHPQSFFEWLCPTAIANTAYVALVLVRSIS